MSEKFAYWSALRDFTRSLDFVRVDLVSDKNLRGWFSGRCLSVELVRIVAFTSEQWSNNLLTPYPQIF